MKIDGPKTSIRIPEDNPGVHYFHYNRPLTPERRFFFIEILKIGNKNYLTFAEICFNDCLLN